MQDPLGIDTAPPAVEVLATRKSPSQPIVSVYQRITNPSVADSLEVRVLLLAHLVFLTYADLKETLAK